MAGSKLYDYPLLFEGFSGDKTGPGTIVPNSFDSTVGRGDIKMIMPFNNFSAEDTFFSLSVGGRPTYLKESYFNCDLRGKQNDGYRKRLLSQPGGQTMSMEQTNNNPFATMEQMFALYYSTPEHDEWLRNFKFRDQNNLKEQSFQFITGPAATNPFVFPSFNVPKNQGRIVGFRFNGSFLVTDVAAADVRLAFSINGQEVVTNMPLSIPSIGSDPTIQRFFLPIEPGSQAQLTMLDPVGATRMDVSFIFDGYE